MSPPKPPSYHDLPGLDVDDEHEETTDVRDLRSVGDPALQQILWKHGLRAKAARDAADAAHVKLAEHEAAHKETAGVAKLALEGVTAIRTEIRTAISTVKTVGWLLGGAFVVGGGIAGLVGWLLSNTHLK